MNIFIRTLIGAILSGTSIFATVAPLAQPAVTQPVIAQAPVADPKPVVAQAPVAVPVAAPTAAAMPIPVATPAPIQAPAQPPVAQAAPVAATPAPIPAQPAVVQAPATVTPAPTPAAVATNTVGDIIVEAGKNPDLSSFLEAVQIAGKTDDAKMTTPPAPFIAFAPNNAAFAAANLPKTKEAMKPLIKNLVTVGTPLDKQGKEALTGELETIAGLKLKADQIKQLIVGSITCSNGTIHIINKVLIPAPAK